MRKELLPERGNLHPRLHGALVYLSLRIQGKRLQRAVLPQTVLPIRRVVPSGRRETRLRVRGGLLGLPLPDPDLQTRPQTRFQAVGRSFSLGVEFCLQRTHTKS